MVKKKKYVITIKTSLKSVLLDNEAAQEFKETWEELVKTRHLLRIGTQQFLHWYLLNEMEPREINVEFISPKESIEKTTTPKHDSIKKQTPKKEKKKYPIHGLVGCRSQKCQNQLRKQFPDKEWAKAKVITRYWNPDVNSTLNMLKCVYYMKRNNGSRLPYMTRPTTNHSMGASSSSGGVSASFDTSL